MRRLTESCFRLSICGVWMAVLSVAALEHCDAAVHTITFAPFNYSPNSLSCAVGDTIEWQGAFASHPLISTIIPAGASSWSQTTGTVFQYIVPVEGTYNYECGFHGQSSNMRGSFTATVTEVNAPGGSQQPATIQLDQNYPNPFNSTTIIRFTLPKAQRTTVWLYDLLGNKVTKLIDERRDAGPNSIEFDASLLATGLYLCRLETADVTAVKKLLLIR